MLPARQSCLRVEIFANTKYCIHEFNVDSTFDLWKCKAERET